MSPRRISRSFRASIGALLGRLALAIAAAVAVPAARADPLPDDSVTLPGPPSYPEDTHVFNGCHLSTIRYLARYLSEFPGESGMPLLIKMRNADGPKRMHTLALVSWKGQAWCRDEYFGVFALGCPYEAQPNLKRLVSKAEILLERHAQTMVRTSGKPLRPNAPEQMSPEQRIRAVKAAVGIIDVYKRQAYSNIKEAVSKQGVIFVNSTEGLREHPEIFRKFFGKVIPTGDNKFSALNSAVFSGGSFIYVPPGVKVSHPLQAYFRINAENFGQFERTLIICDEGSELTYMEGCTAPKFSTATLHSAVVELVALKGAKIQYITVQNWSSNVFNLVTKRGLAHEEAEIKWIDCNIGSRLTMKYPGVVLKGRKARGEVISIALANDGQHQDTGAKMIHAADETTSTVVSKSISVGQGRATYRGVVHIPRHLKGCKNNTECDALLISTNSRTDTYPAITVRGDHHAVQHEASVSKVSAEQIFYMQQRGLTEGQAMSLSVNGFINDLARQFPMEYSVELKRLIDLEMEGSVG